jgi:hypothetical protein
MDTGIVFALVLTVVFFGGLFWLGVHARNEAAREANRSDAQPPTASQSEKKRAA